MIDLNKAGAWDAKEQLEIAELLRKCAENMVEIYDSHRDPESINYNECEGVMCAWCEDAKPVIDAATGGESDE